MSILRAGSLARVLALAWAWCASGTTPATFEDIYGPSGASFQGAVGFRVVEGSPATGTSGTSFGVAIDDMVVQWREYKLVGDATDCATSGSCASVAIDSGEASNPNGSIGITVVDSSPYGQATPVNDCNQDGDFVDGGIDDQDCNDNGTTDVVVRASSLAEPAGELVVLDRIGASHAYRGRLAISSFVNVPGVLYFVWGGPNNSEGTVRYDDRWDGSASGIECRASSNPADWGTVSADVILSTIAGNLSIVKYRISDGPGTGTPPLPAGQDGDGYPDTNETVDLFLTVRNQTGVLLTNLVAQISTSDPKIGCILSPVVVLGSLPADATVDLPNALRFTVAPSADRFGVAPAVSCGAGTCSNGAGACSIATDCKKTVNESFAATLTVTLAADQFDAAVSPQSVLLDLDLNASVPVKATSTFIDGFESGLTNFVHQNLDVSIASNTLSNGMRCQYHDPDFINSNSYGDTECYLGFALGSFIANDWHIHDTDHPGGGRAYQGVRSLHYGIHTPGDAGLDTYGMSQMDAVRSKSAVNLAARVCRDDPSIDKRACNSGSDCVGVGGGLCVSANPELSFKHQVALADRHEELHDRAVVHAQVFAAGAPWHKLVPYQNVYQSPVIDWISNCSFDPIDDGNNEDSYFDPTDPGRRLGPSSTCYPEFVFSNLGDTDSPFSATNIGRASDGPGLQGSLGTGTWVESKFDLSQFRGRSIRIRWLLTSIKVADTSTWEALFHWNPNPGDDGWYVDDVRVTQTLGTTAPTVSQDTIDNSALPGCGIACTTLTAAFTATPPATISPGVLVGLSTVGSLADRCIGGTLLSEYWIDGDANGALGDPADVLVRSPAVDPLFQDAPLVTTRYGARVRCSSAPAACTDTRFLVVSVGCPGTPGVYNAEAWWTKLRFTNKTTLVVPPATQLLDAARGDLGALRSSGSFGGELCLADGSASTTLTDAATPALGTGYYYLMRGTDAACNENRSWRTFSPKESPTDPGRRDTQNTGCGPSASFTAPGSSRSR